MGEFNWYKIDNGEDSIAEADPTINRANLKRKATETTILQDIGLNFYWSSGVGDTEAPGVKEYRQNELKQNMLALMQRGDLSYKKLEEFLATIGYNVYEVRNMFRDISGLDPQHLEYMRLESFRNTPGSIPGYNYGWGLSKAKSYDYLFIMPWKNIYAIFGQKGDMQRDELDAYLTYDEAKKALRERADRVLFYDQPAAEEIVDFNNLSKMIEEPVSSNSYKVWADHLWQLKKLGQLNETKAANEIQHSIDSGLLTLEEGKQLLRIYCEEEKAPEQVEKDKNVEDEARVTTPKEFFEEVAPKRVDTISAEHIKAITDFIAHKDQQLKDFDLKLHSLKYISHEAPKMTTEPELSDGEVMPGQDLYATVSVILEIKDISLSTDKNKKMGLLVFLISGSGEATTDDNVVSVDGNIYALTSEGLKAMFRKERDAVGAK